MSGPAAAAGWGFLDEVAGAGWSSSLSDSSSSSNKSSSSSSFKCASSSSSSMSSSSSRSSSLGACFCLLPAPPGCCFKLLCWVGGLTVVGWVLPLGRYLFWVLPVAARDVMGCVHGVFRTARRRPPVCERCYVL